MLNFAALKNFGLILLVFLVPLVLRSQTSDGGLEGSLIDSIVFPPIG